MDWSLSSTILSQSCDEVRRAVGNDTHADQDHEDVDPDCGVSQYSQPLHCTDLTEQETGSCPDNAAYDEAEVSLGDLRETLSVA